MKVLIVDDDPDVRAFLSSSMDVAGCEQIDRFVETPGGTIDIQRTLFGAQVVSLEDADGFVLEVRDSSGESSVVEADGGIFENGSFRVEYDTVIWQSGE